MPNRGRRNPRKLSRTRQGPAANALNNEQTNYRSMATEALRLLLAQHNLVQTGTRQQLVARLETHFNNPPPAGVTVADTSSTNTLPQQELAQIISSLIDEKLAARQDGGQPNQQHNWLAPTPHTGSYSTIPSPPAPSATQDGGQPSQRFPCLQPIRWRPTTTTERRYTAASLSYLQSIGSSQRCRSASGFSSTLAG